MSYYLMSHVLAQRHSYTFHLFASLLSKAASKKSDIYSLSYRIQTTYTSSSPSKDFVVFRHALKYRGQIALQDRNGAYLYEDVYERSVGLAREITDLIAPGKLQERVAFLCPNEVIYVLTQWACWMGGHVAIPLCKSHPTPVLEYYIQDSKASLVVTTKEYVENLWPIIKQHGQKLLVLDSHWWENPKVVNVGNAEQNQSVSELESKQHVEQLGNLELSGMEDTFCADKVAMIIYASGTSGPPKGVVLTHSNLYATVSSLLEAWDWTSSDIILHTLPLHHLHGVINMLLCPLFVGARCVMLPEFEPCKVWSHLLAINQPSTERVNLFMAVPTIYAKLIEKYDEKFSKKSQMREYVKAVCSQNIRLMVSGSSPAPQTVIDRWFEITGHKILNRYGITEAGMVLSQHLKGKRKSGFVGTPLPRVTVRIAKFLPSVSQEKYDIICQGSSCETHVTPGMEGEIGELLVKGPGVFQGYWNQPEATEKAFTKDGWFRTGDTAQFTDGSYKILGRTSVDIIKSGGYKISALVVEGCLLEHKNIVDVAVVGLPDLTWGQKVAAVLVLQPGTEVTPDDLKSWAQKKMAYYSIPTVWKIVDAIPKNTMGKVSKKALVQTLFPKESKYF